MNLSYLVSIIQIFLFPARLPMALQQTGQRSIVDAKVGEID